MIRLRDAIRAVLEAYDVAGRRLRAYAAEPVVAPPAPTVGEQQQRQLERDEELKLRQQAAADYYRERLAVQVAQNAELEQRLRQAEAEAAAAREAAEIEQARDDYGRRVAAGVMPS